MSFFKMSEEMKSLGLGISTGLREDMGVPRPLLSKTRRGKNYTGMMGVTGFIRFYELKHTQTAARGAIRLPPTTQTLLKGTTIPEMNTGTTQIAGGMDRIEITGTIEVAGTIKGTEKTSEGLEKTTQDVERMTTEGMERKITGGMEKKATEGREITRVKGTTEGMRTTNITGNIEAMNNTEVTVQLMLTSLDPSESREGRTVILVMHP